MTQKHLAFVNDSDRLTINPYSSTYSNRSSGIQVASRPLQQSTVQLALIRPSYRILSTFGLSPTTLYGRQFNPSTTPCRLASLFTYVYILQRLDNCRHEL